MDSSRQARARKLRAKYRRNLRIAIVLCLIIGLAGGFFLGRMSAGAPVIPEDMSFIENFTSGISFGAKSTPAPTENPLLGRLGTPKPTATPEAVVTVAPTEAPTAEPTEAPTATPAPTAVVTPAPEAVEVIVPFGETQTIAVEALSDGTVRKTAGDEAFETLNFSVRVTRYLSNEYYNQTYGNSYRLMGNEAGVEFELLLNDYMGAVKLDPNALLKNTGVESADGKVSLGYRFTDKEISGEDEFVITTNVPMLVYKRFDNTGAEMKYLTFTTYIDGVEHAYKFELGEPVVEAPTATPAPVVYAQLVIGSNGEEVVKLQTRLIELGYLAEGSADGAYGNMTANAIRAAQKDFGMTEDGVASNDFQQKLFAAN